MAKKVLVIGAAGLLGSYIMDARFNLPDVDFLGTHYIQPCPGTVKLELEKKDTIQKIVDQFHPDIVYVSGYMTNVDRCEREGNARRINVGGIKNLLEVVGQNVKVVFISSSYVFDGSKNDPYDIWDIPMPIQQYGIQKLLAENIVLSGGPENMVVRTCGIVGNETARKNFAYQVFDKLGRGEEFKAYSDQLLAPIHAESLANSMVEMVRDGVCGLVHINGNEIVTKYEFAYDIASNLLGYDYARKIKPTTAGESPQPALRPYNACLKNTTFIPTSYEEMLGKLYAIK